MGLFTKIKDILFEEEVEETASIPKQRATVEEKKFPTVPVKEKTAEVILPVKKEIKKVEKPQVEEKMKDRDVFKNDPTFPFPLAFEEDIKDEQSRSNKNTNILDLEIKRRKERDLPNRRILEEPKKEPEIEPFRPSPIISPVYGILDKNYKKEDVVNKGKRGKKVSIDKPDFETVRKKAYGTLEEDIENTLNKKMEPIIEETPNKTIDDLLLDTLSIEMTEEIELPKTVGDAEEAMKLEEDEEDIKDEQLENDTLENDLFDLIDSMYEKKEDGE